MVNESINNTVSRLLEELKFLKDNYSKIPSASIPFAYVIHPEIYSYVKYYFDKIDSTGRINNIPLRLKFGMNFYEDRKLKDLNNVPSYKVFYNEPELDEYYRLSKLF
jgi:hypothetical protein